MESARRTGDRPVIDFSRLTTVPISDLHRLLSEPRNARHLPLATPMNVAEVERWVAAKDELWHRDGVGPWAIRIDGEFAGWGGFQLDDGDADLALVLLPAFRGHGVAVAREALRIGFDRLRLSEVTVALPYSRRADGPMQRWGFEPDGVARHGGVDFRKYRLTASAWRRVLRASDEPSSPRP